MQSDTTGFLQEFHKILEEAGKKGASDIHYVPKEQLLLRIDGRLVDMTEEWNVVFFHGGTHRGIAGQKTAENIRRKWRGRIFLPGFQ